MADSFWRKWIREYLPTIARRTKWFYPTKPLQEGDVVVIVDENNPRNSWPKGVILEVRRSADGQVRSAVVKTTTGCYVRPAVKLAKLDVATGVVEDVSKSLTPSAVYGGENVGDNNTTPQISTGLEMTNIIN